MVSQKSTSGVVYYAVGEAGEQARRQSVPRAQQSAACQSLLSDLFERIGALDEGLECRTSMSHSRAVCAAAIGVGCRVGLDVEWMAEDRNGGAILDLLFDLRLPSLSMEDFYRAWTFHEAYFKAIGAVADRQAIIRVIEGPSDEITLQMNNKDTSVVHAIHRKWRDEFMLSLAWTLGDGRGPVDAIPIFPIVIQLV